MQRIIFALGLIVSLTGCEALYQSNDGIPRIRSLADAEAYNSTVSAESDKLVCTRERGIGSNIPQFVCLTVGQRERLAQQAVEDIQSIGVERVIGN